MERNINEKIDLINSLFMQMENKPGVSLIDILKEEITKLKKLNKEYKELIDGKSIVHTEKRTSKTRYHLADGSTYVVDRNNKYRYLYDVKTKIITYEFPNGQVEKSYPVGIKEIRYPDGTIGVRTGNKEYEYLK
ncbi:T-complex protein 10 [Spraguea lophii 42_110]|uniref:T-complex protein 10 n=1 Tax=Spraguea lophii (strain 42_110) TaxID=1358809 RepID=S7W582_SPRLO|nr:T-complex protein 10 [Spraguea lophii 42_110]